MTAARIMLPPELERADYDEYVRLRRTLTRDEAVREIRNRRSKKIVQELYKAGQKPSQPGAKPRPRPRF